MKEGKLVGVTEGPKTNRALAAVELVDPVPNFEAREFRIQRRCPAGSFPPPGSIIYKEMAPEACAPKARLEQPAPLLPAWVQQVQVLGGPWLRLSLASMIRAAAWQLVS